MPNGDGNGRYGTDKKGKKLNWGTSWFTSTGNAQGVQARPFIELFFVFVFIDFFNFFCFIKHNFFLTVNFYSIRFYTVSLLYYRNYYCEAWSHRPWALTELQHLLLLLFFLWYRIKLRNKKVRSERILLYFQYRVFLFCLK